MTTEELFAIAGPIIAKAELVFGIRYREMASNCRFYQHSLARHAVCFVLRGRDIPLQDIGAILGGIDHTTVIYGINRVKQDAPRNGRGSKQLREFLREFETVRSC